jgi:hypothetical protein
VQLARLERETQRLAGAEQVPLPDEFIQRLGPQEFGQGRLGLCRE